MTSEEPRRPAGRPVPHVVDPAWVPDAPLVPPSAVGGLGDVFRRRYLLRLLVQKEIQARYSGSVLGLLWSYVLPLIKFTVYYFVIGFVLGLHSDIPNFPVHMFCALVFVGYFTEMFSSGTRAIVRNKAIVRKMAMPKEMFPVSAVLVSAFHAVPQAVMLAVFAVVSGWSPDLTGLAAGLLGFTILSLFGTGLALMFSAFNVFFRDFQQVVATFTLFTHWAVPQFYPYSRLAESSLGGTWVEQAYLANPLSIAVIMLQRAFWVPTCDDSPVCTGPTAMPDHLLERGLIMLVVGALFLLLSQWTFSKLEGKFAEQL